MVGYFTGYIAKRQPIGRYELKLSTQNLPLMKTKLERWSPSHQLAQVVNRMYADLEAKGVLRKWSCPLCTCLLGNYVGAVNGEVTVEL